jgi:hypothetical protein
MIPVRRIYSSFRKMRIISALCSLMASARSGVMFSAGYTFRVSSVLLAVRASPAPEMAYRVSPTLETPHLLARCQPPSALRRPRARTSQSGGQALFGWSDADNVLALSEQDRKNKTLRHQREWALIQAQIIVHAHISQECYPVLSRELRRTANNVYETASFFQGWGLAHF